MSSAAPAGHTHLTAAALFPVLMLALVWGCNWPVLKMGVTDMAPLTFRTLTLPFAALGMMAAAKWSGDAIRIPRRLWRKVAVLALFNITFWNAFVLFGLAQLPAGRSAILAYTMPIWGVLFSLVVLDEPLARRKIAGMALGMAGLALLLGEDIRHFQRAPVAALLIVAAAISWGIGTVLLRKWQLPVAPNALSGWMMLLGAIPIAILAPVMATGVPRMPSPEGWFAVLYNIFLAGTVAHWAWYRLARTLPVAVSSMSSLPVPVVGVFSSMLFLGERPGLAEWAALALIMAAMVAVLWPARTVSARAAADD
jgi:drug/metabolite transporter (DMT)-like permease